ncbi:MAG: response regulator transcription factor [Leptospiraceae bacterium]|nr:response regulator transcription factor [Leptospiraceae bacterium]
MKILIVEDEPVTARYIKSLVEEIFGDKKYSISIQSNLLSSECYLLDNEIDLLLLDLNLNGEDGFELLEHAVASSFHTIVISGNIDKALVAFEYGVIDFIPKPFDRERLETALQRLENKLEIRKSLKKISIRKDDSILLLPIESINFFEADGKNTKIHLKSGNIEPYKKNLNALEQILPPDFYRVHKSYLVSLENIKEIKMRNENSPHAITFNEKEIPIARRPFRELQDKFFF